MKLFKYLMLLILVFPFIYACSDSPTEINTTSAPEFSPAGGTYLTNQLVTITCATEGAAIHYTVNGTEPDTLSALYSTPIAVNANMTIKAIATKAGLNKSQIVTAVYVINQVASPVFTPAAGTYNSAQSVIITTATSGATIRFTTNGSDPDTTSTVYTVPINVITNTTIKAKAFKVGFNPSGTVSAAYVITSNMVNIPAGTFTMGRASGTGYADEQPTHSVTLSAFYIGKYEVKQSEWLAVMGSNPSSFTGDTSRPVEMVSFYSVMVYCNKRSINEGLTPAYTINGSTDPATWGAIPTTNNATWNAATFSYSATGYRLPTEAEWEYAARGATNSPDYLYAGSNTVGDVSWYDTNAGSTTHVVGQKTANGLGLYDMSGNVQEWVWDWYGTYSSGAVTNPTGPSSNPTDLHVIRGGSWDQTNNASRVVYRSYGTPEKNSPKVFNDRLGFRVVRM
jgi:formylglycine-generating enzyme required for sulfatase activity